MQPELQKGIVHIYLLVGVLLIGVLVFFLFFKGYLSFNKVNLDLLKDFDGFKTTIISTPTENPVLGIYELEDSVFFTTKSDVNAKFLHWLQPETKTSMYLGTGVAFNTKANSITKKGFGYQIVVTEANGSESASENYIFQGSRVVIEDSRCEGESISEIIKIINSQCSKQTTCFILSELEPDTCPFDKTREQKLMREEAERLERNSNKICTDSDNGLNQEVRGDISFRQFDSYGSVMATSDPSDECVDIYAGGSTKNVLREYYCDNNNNVQYEHIECPKGCKAGVCIQ
jgi:hypothetical protein